MQFGVVPNNYGLYKGITQRRNILNAEWMENLALENMKLRTCVTPEGKFVYGIHRPSFITANLRENDFQLTLGLETSGKPVVNEGNFPPGDVEEQQAEWIFEIPNPFAFRGTTYIDRNWAKTKAEDPISIKLPGQASTSMTDFLRSLLGYKEVTGDRLNEAFAGLPQTVLLALASISTDPHDLVRLAELSCEFVYDQGERMPFGLRYKEDARGNLIPKILNHDLFEALVNNSFLPDIYKEVMVLRPGVQGSSEIVGEYPSRMNSHVYEYLRRNSYIPWGHYASNIANDLVRYSIADLSDDDFVGLRHIYYQRTFVRLADQLGIAVAIRQRALTVPELENLRREVTREISVQGRLSLRFDATLWGWNYGFDFAPSGYRLHASHQQIHQQFAMVPKEVAAVKENVMIPSYSCGDQVADFIRLYQKEYDSGFFGDYIRATRNNDRMDGSNDRQADLVIYADENIMLFVPKAQTSQWELQLVTLVPVGNVIEADIAMRRSLDRGILTAMRILSGMGARLITVIEFSKRIGVTELDQRLLYSFLPKIPYSMGAFSEAQLRFISGHYPEDFAVACRLQLENKQ
jgi:hypothetical protein